MTSSSTPVAPPQSTSLHDRISELESLVVTLMEGQSPSGPPLAPRSLRAKESEDEATDPGTLKVCKSGSSYVQSVHWEAILTQIKGLKEDLVSESKTPTGSHLFYGPNRHATRDEILAAVPPRPVVDRLIALHFDSYFVTACQYTRALFPFSDALGVLAYLPQDQLR